MNPLYGRNYYEWLRVVSRRSAEVIIPYIIPLVNPCSVIDIGCATGEWLAVFKQHGVKDVMGIDGAWVDRDLLSIENSQFIVQNINEKELLLDRNFDLAVTLEAVQHVSMDRIKYFVRQLTRLAPVVMFSAPIPHQGGSGPDVNEQWPAHWAELFEEQGFRAVDCIREKIWDDDRVEWWYAQNMLFFVDLNRIDDFPLLKEKMEKTPRRPHSRIHPKLYLFQQSIRPSKYSLLDKCSSLQFVAWRSIKRGFYNKSGKNKV